MDTLKEKIEKLSELVAAITKLSKRVGILIAVIRIILRMLTL